MELNTELLCEMKEVLRDTKGAELAHRIFPVEQMPYIPHLISSSYHPLATLKPCYMLGTNLVMGLYQWAEHVAALRELNF